MERVGPSEANEVGVRPGPDLTIQADADQLEQLLINLVRNAVDAALETRGQVEVSWSVIGNRLHVAVTDEGPGLPVDTGNLFRTLLHNQTRRERNRSGPLPADCGRPRWYADARKFSRRDGGQGPPHDPPGPYFG